MAKTILLTGATDGIGLETARMLTAEGHNLLLHGRSPAKLDKVMAELSALPNAASLAPFVADLSTLSASVTLAEQIVAHTQKVDVLINNAGVFKVRDSRTPDGLDVRFAVNTFAPYILARLLAPIIGSDGRIVNLSSAAQAPIEAVAVEGSMPMSDNAAYAQSKLAITMWTRQLADVWGNTGPLVLAVNPASLLGSNMVKEAYGMAGKSLSIGAKILVRSALSEEFADANGRYFDNDTGAFADPHPHALEQDRNAQLVATMDRVLAEKGVALPAL